MMPIWRNFVREVESSSVIALDAETFEQLFYSVSTSAEMISARKKEENLIKSPWNGNFIRRNFSFVSTRSEREDKSLNGLKTFAAEDRVENERWKLEK